MTDKEAIERLNNFKTIRVLYGNTFAMHLEQLKQLQSDIETVLNLIQTQQAEIEQLKIAGNGMDLLLKQKTAEIEKKDEWINKLENKLMYALTPTKHELAKRTQEEFKEILEILKKE